jgi:hypothetical protein
VEDDSFVSLPCWQPTVSYMNLPQKSSLRTWKTVTPQEPIEPVEFRSTLSKNTSPDSVVYEFPIDLILHPTTPQSADFSR